MKSYISFFILIICIYQGISQQSGIVNYAQLGISFEIPDGWIGQETGDYFLMQSNATPGFILMMIEEYSSIDEMKSDIKMGYKEGFSTNLTPVGSISLLDDNTLVGEYSGKVEGEPAKAYLTGTINPHGSDVIVLAITSSDLYSKKYKQLALSLEKSLQFKSPLKAEVSNDWMTMLSGVRLTYMDSYSSTSGGISGGYSNEIKIDLCQAGYFNYYGNNSMTIGSDVSSGYSGGNTQGNGKWAIEGDKLKLSFNNGKVWEYILSISDEKLYLDNDRYFRTWSGEFAPDCN